MKFQEGDRVRFLTRPEMLERFRYQDGEFIEEEYGRRMFDESCSILFGAEGVVTSCTEVNDVYSKASYELVWVKTPDGSYHGFDAAVFEPVQPATVQPHTVGWLMSILSACDPNAKVFIGEHGARPLYDVSETITRSDNNRSEVTLF